MMYKESRDRVTVREAVEVLTILDQAPQEPSLWWEDWVTSKRVVQDLMWRLQADPSSQKSYQDPSRSVDHEASLKISAHVDGPIEEEGLSPLIHTCFILVYEYLMDFYTQSNIRQLDRRALEGVREVMSILTKSWRVLQELQQLFPQLSCQGIDQEDLMELQKLYKTVIEPRLEEEMLSQWMVHLMEFPFQNFTYSLESSYADPSHIELPPLSIEDVKRDSHYDLLFLKKADHTRFYHPNLRKMLRLIADTENLDPFTHNRLLHTLLLCRQERDHALVFQLRSRLQPLYAFFLQNRYKIKEKNLKRLIASFMIALRVVYLKNPDEISTQKGLVEYFKDFWFFLNQAIRHVEYQKLVAYPLSLHNRIGHFLKNIIEQTVRVVLFEDVGVLRIAPYLTHWIREGYLLDPNIDERDLTLSISQTLLVDHCALTKVFEPYTPHFFKKILHDMIDHEHTGYQGITSENFPSRIVECIYSDVCVPWVLFPSPTYQETLDEVTLLPEFAAALRGYIREYPENNILWINFQSRRSPLESARTRCLEEASEHEDFGFALDLITLDAEHPLYAQMPPYHQDQDARTFQKQWTNFFESSAFSFPLMCKDLLFPLYVEQMLLEIHALFFGQKPQLTLHERQAMIDLAYMFLVIKALDVLRPSMVLWTCKDCVSRSPFHVALVYTFFMIMHDQSWGQTHREWLNALIMGPSLLVRERVAQREEIVRFANVVGVMESTVKKLGPQMFRDHIMVRFGRLFHHNILDAKMRPLT